MLRAFVTVGTELPFNRLVGAIDAWAGRRGGERIVAQIGHGAIQPRHMEWHERIDGPRFGELFDTADVVVAHAGMGTIVRALERRRPLIVVPRRADLGEHRNDHQLATVARLRELGLVHAADDEDELVRMLDAGEAPIPATSIGPFASASLLEAVRRGLHG